MTLYEKSMSTLELDRVLDKLSELAVSEEAKEKCRHLRPSEEYDEVCKLQRQTSAAARLIALKGSPSFSDVKPVSASLDRADRGGALNPVELLRIAGVLRCTRSIRAYADGENMSTMLDSLFWKLTPNRYLEEKITGAILSEDEISDAASTELADIRRHMRATNAKVREILQKVISSPTYAKALREQIITLRNDRYVVPVKSECKNEIPGLVHDVSSSGGTFFVEPLGVVNANNELRELLAKEKREIERILAELSAECAEYRESITDNYSVLVHLDLIFARAKLSWNMKAMEPELRQDGVIELKNARHPLINPKTVVPSTIRLGSDFDTLVITGPNTGGKTVTLKTIGLLTLMAECGLHIPVDDGSKVSVFDSVLADIGDEQSIEQSLSTFSSHMKNIVSIIQDCGPRSLILFDELGAGTDPTEGAALAIAVIEHCRNAGANIAATTHYSELKIYGMRTDGVLNACCEFDVETLRPTYRLLIGIPGKSNAFNISRRLGLPESIIENARSMVDEKDLNFEDVLNQLEQQRRAMEEARVEAERLRIETEKQKKQSDAFAAEIQREKDAALQKARQEAQSIIDDARRNANLVMDELKQMRKHLQDVGDAQSMNLKNAELRRQLNEAERNITPEKTQPVKKQDSRPLRVGDTVELIRLGTKATILSMEKDGTILLQAGIMKTKVKPEEVNLIEEIPQAQKIIAHSERELRTLGASPELDIRGLAADEALPVLDLFLDNASMANLTSVRIIHGKGTGVLRKAVRTHLRKSPYISSFRSGVYGEGEDGVTIAEMK